MGKPMVFITRVIVPEALDMIAQVANMEVWPGEIPPSYNMLVEKARDAKGLLTMLTDNVNAALMDSAPKLKVISNMAVGYDNIDIDKATEKHILVGHTPGILTETTADFTFSLLMAAARRIVEADNYTRKGRWKTWGPMILLGQDIHHATLGIIGMGRIGIEVVKRARGFNMKVLYYDITRLDTDLEKQLDLKYAPRLEELLTSADIISVHVPLLPQTYHLIGADEFAIMKPQAVFVNTSRGPVVDQKALYEALKSGRISSAAIDVTETEPISPDDPLLTLDNIIITPHVASASHTTRRKMAIMAAGNLLAGLNNEIPPNCVNPQAQIST